MNKEYIKQARETDKISINEIYNTLLNDYNIDFTFDENELLKLPKESPFLIVSNHPLKGIDSILLLKVISQARPDIKITNDIVLPKYTEVNRFFVVENSKHFLQRINGAMRRKTLEYLKKGKPVGIFPAGDFNTHDITHNLSHDPTWSTENIGFIKSAKVPVVPVYFQVKTSFLQAFKNHNYWLLPERFQKKSEDNFRKIRLRIGAAISVNDQDQFNNFDKFGRFLRSKVYCLKSPVEVKQFYIPGLFREPKEHEIIAPQDPTKVTHEVETLKKDYLLFDSSKYSVVCAPVDQMPVTMQEIGRLRELTFRKIGEGTNRAIDIDEFDLYYNQLFIWDNEQNNLVGAYRVGLGNDIMQQFDFKGFYIQSLFRIDKKAKSLLSQSLELGRSFIVEKYQRQPLALFLLWKGILYFLLKNPEYRYLIGPVSISNRYSKISKSLIINFMKQHFMHKEFAKLFKPRNSFKPNTSYDIDILLENTQSNIKKLDSIISDIELDNYKVPVLLKKYLNLNARLLAFNIDPKFNNALDGLIILDLLEVPYKVIQTLSKEINDETILKRFTTI